MSFLTLSLPKEAANLFNSAAFEIRSSRVDFWQATTAATKIGCTKFN
jgi:hypothetical protein